MSSKDDRIIEALRRSDRPADIAAREGCHVSRVYQLKRSAGIDTVHRPPGPRRGCDEPELSPLAVRIGKRVEVWARVTHDHSWREAAAIVGVSRERFIRICRGTWPIALPELERLAAALNVRPDELVG